MALPVGKNITLYQGDTFHLSFTLYEKDAQGNQGPAIDLTGATVTAQIRATAANPSVMATFTGTHNGVGGKATISLTSAQTSALSAGGVWDVQVEFPGGDVKTYLAGTVTLVKEVTRVAP
jgi:hypothetical protein